MVQFYVQFTLEHSRDIQGFTLIETLISIFIIGAMIAMFATGSATFTLTRDAKFEDIAAHIAHTKLAQLRAGGYGALPADGPFTDPLLTSLPRGAASTTTAVFNAKTKRVNVIVGWKRANTERSVTLTTLVTEIGGL